MNVPAELNQLRQSLLLEEPVMPSEHRQAAVAIILRAAAEGPLVLLMQRAERPGDRWSGQISLPGGHREAADASLSATAARETREEVGLDLEQRGERLGHLEPVQALARGRRLELSIAPVVFACRGRESEGAPELELGPEAEDAFWLPLQAAASGELDHGHSYEHEGQQLLLPSWRFEERVVWGLTHKILGTFLPHLDRG